MSFGQVDSIPQKKLKVEVLFNVTDALGRGAGNSGIQNTKELDPIFKDGSGNITRLNLTYVEKKALVVFLNTPTDNTFIADPKFSNPFN